jgi:uncharacterized protein (TIGR00251 family)
VAAARSPSWLSARADGVRLAVKVTPRAGRDAVQGVEVDAKGQAWLAVRVTAAPEGGQANAALIKLLAKRWRLPGSAVRLIAGASARRKVLHVAGAAEALLAQLEAIERPGGGQRP